jgi:hypothetical protein
MAALDWSMCRGRRVRPSRLREAWFPGSLGPVVTVINVIARKRALRLPPGTSSSAAGGFMNSQRMNWLDHGVAQTLSPRPSLVGTRVSGPITIWRSAKLRHQVHRRPSRPARRTIGDYYRRFAWCSITSLPDPRTLRNIDVGRR